MHAITIVVDWLRCLLWDRRSALVSTEIELSILFPLLRTLFAYMTMDITNGLWDRTLVNQPILSDIACLNKRQHTWYEAIVSSECLAKAVYTMIGGKWFRAPTNLLPRNCLPNDRMLAV